MSDVFISYSKADKAIAEALADDLKSRGFDVWWDFELYAGQDFHDTILAALDASRAVIVIWSDTAVRSPWVRDEANRAASQDKLITTHSSGFSVNRLPLGMGQRQCVKVEHRGEVYRALAALCGEPRTHVQSSARRDHLLTREVIFGPCLFLLHATRRELEGEPSLQKSIQALDSLIRRVDGNDYNLPQLQRVFDLCVSIGTDLLSIAEAKGVDPETYRPTACAIRILDCINERINDPLDELKGTAR